MFERVLLTFLRQICLGTTAMSKLTELFETEPNPFSTSQQHHPILGCTYILFKSSRPLLAAHTEGKYSIGSGNETSWLQS